VVVVGKVLVDKCVASGSTIDQGVGWDFFGVKGYGACHNEMIPIHRPFFDGNVFNCGAGNRECIRHYGIQDRQITRKRAIILFLAYTFPDCGLESAQAGTSGVDSIIATAPLKERPGVLGLFGQSRAMWLKPPQYKHRPSSIRFCRSSGDRQRPAAERSIGAVPR
jgi:hypothetical protein